MSPPVRQQGRWSVELPDHAGIQHQHLDRINTTSLTSLLTLLLSMMVLSLWAMVSTVQEANSALMVSCTRSSVSRSTAAVASSRTST